MNIYIYGKNSFKKEIQETLEHANIRFKLDSDSIIEEIEDLEVLKSTIEKNPNDIYLIDDEKIIKKNVLTQKIKFLTPKDGIEEVFLLDNGIADLSVDSLKEIPKYILKKYEEKKDLNIHKSIVDIVDEAYEEDDNILNIELDDELSSLLSSKKEDQEKKEYININLNEIENLISDDNHKKSDFKEDVGLNNISSDYDEEKYINDTISSEKNEEITNKDYLEEDNMLNDLTELDSLKEEDVLNAIKGIDNSSAVQNSKIDKEEIQFESTSVKDIAEVLSKLLNNKSLEITIKIKV